MTPEAQEQLQEAQWQQEERRHSMLVQMLQARSQERCHALCCANLNLPCRGIPARR